ncbi:low affinity immunoglobulin gamma Fc region receptor II-like protein [Labeo rohita]|nr:low affinity immunoglobulin gamma Fc region receptor II-like protein [Labeo rohita]
MSTDKEFSIGTGESDSSNNITCIGERKRDGQKSEISDAVSLAISHIVIGHSDVTYVKIDLKSMKEMKKKKRENKGAVAASSQKLVN